jgi:ribonucleoside-diphosphate reductase beta chain
MALAESSSPAILEAPLVTPASAATAQTSILDPGFNLTLRPMRYPEFYEMFRNAIRNTWTVEEIDFSDDIIDLDRKLLPAEKHLINRLVAFFATGDSIVANNLALNLYKHVNAPEARLYLSRQLYEEAYTSSSISRCSTATSPISTSGPRRLPPSRPSPRSA